MAKKGMFDFFKSQADEDNKHNANDGYKVSLQRPFGSPEQTTVSAPALNTPDGQQPKENQPHQDSYGVTGQQVFAGFDGEEPNPFLSNRQGYIAFDNMERMDAQVYSTVQRQRDKIKEADFFLEPVDDKDDEQAKHAEIASDCFFNKQEKIWLDNLNDILTYFRGHAVFEPVWKIIDYPKVGKLWTVRKLGLKSARTLWQFFIVNDKIWSIRQISYGDDQRYVDIPGDELLIFIYNREGNNFWGRSPLRPMYGPVDRKEQYLRTTLQGIKVNAKGITTVEVPLKAINSNEYSAMTTALSNFWKGFTNWITHPVGWKLDHKPMDFKAQEVEAMLKFENMEISQAGGNDQSQLGQSTRGAQGLHQGKQDEANISVKVQAAYICAMLQKLIDAFYLYNWGKDAVPAKLTFTGIDNKANFEEAQKDQVIAQILPELVNDPIYKAYIHKKYEIPGGDEIEEAGDEKTPAKVDKDGNPIPQEPAPQQPAGKKSAAPQPANNKAQQLNEGHSCGCGHDAPVRLSAAAAKERRALTPYEEKLQLTEMASHINDFTDKYTNEIRNSFKNYILPRYSKELKQALEDAKTEAQKYNAVINTALEKKEKVKSIIKTLLLEQVSRGYIAAKKEVKTKKLAGDFDDLPTGAYGWCVANSDILTDTLFNDVHKKLKLSAVKDIDNGKTAAQIVFNALEDAEYFLSKDTNIGAQYISVKALNDGRFNAFHEAKDEIQGFQFSAILETACPLCAELDGKTFKIDDPDSTEYEPPLHPNCNCILVPILMDEEAPKKWDGLDESVSDKNEKFKKLSEVK